MTDTFEIRITEPGFENLNGNIGEVTFVNGVGRVNRVQLGRIGSAMRVEHVTGGSAGPGQDSIDLHKAVTVVVDDLPHLKPGQKIQQAEPVPPPKPKMTIYTEDQLGALADTGGIAALRVIGTPLGVKSNSISALIKAILEAQKVAIAKGEV